MKSLSQLRTIGFVVTALVTLGTAPAAQAGEQCSPRSVAGDWGYTITGTRLPLGPAASVGTFHLDRNGNVTGLQTLSVNGIIAQDEVLAGTVAVSPDCTGSATITVSNTPFPRTAHLDLVWLNSSSELRAIFVDAGLILTMDAKRINHGDD
jgi:hypothetical protein